MASSPASASASTTAAGPTPSGSRIGRPPQWTVSRSRKLARLYLYSTLSIDKIIRVLEDDGFSPRKNSAQKTIHKMLDNDPRYLRPESRSEMTKRIKSLSASPARRRGRKGGPARRAAADRASLERQDPLSSSEVTSPTGISVKGEDVPAFDFSASPEVSTFGYFANPFGQEQTKETAVATENAWPEMAREIKRRVSDCSSHYALQLCSLIKDFTISIASDEGGRSRRASMALSEVSDTELPECEMSVEAYEAFPDPGFALPGDFLTAHTRSCADFPGQPHGSGRCWCAIAEETSADPNSWVLPTGELSRRAAYLLAHPSPKNVVLADSFGNTPLHLFAALEGYQEALLGMVFAAGINGLQAANTGGQTFLHLLHLEWFTQPADTSGPLNRLLMYIRATCPDLVYETDVYGRTFFHRAHSVIRDPATLSSITALFNPTLASRRDAFGFNPVASTSSPSSAPSPYIPPRRTASPSPEARASPTSRPQSATSEDSFLTYHAHLVRVIHSSYTSPLTEDSAGRNGLHCLAEAILHQQTMDRHVQSTPSTRPQLKRKLTTPPPSDNTPAEAPLPTRLRHLHSLLHPTVSVPTTAYSLAGLTPLMSFITHISDEQDDKARTLQTLLETLIRASPPQALEARNRAGETALLVAARLGRK
ncbi:hypothetical protein C8A05DRAFT_35555, partial [Staphylotrichum tortipilum]